MIYSFVELFFSTARRFLDDRTPECGKSRGQPLESAPQATLAGRDAGTRCRMRVAGIGGPREPIFCAFACPGFLGTASQAVLRSQAPLAAFCGAVSQNGEVARCHSHLRVPHLVPAVGARLRWRPSTGSGEGAPRRHSRRYWVRMPSCSSGGGADAPRPVPAWGS